MFSMVILECNGDPHSGFITAVRAKHVVEQLALYYLCKIKNDLVENFSLYTVHPPPHCLDDY